MANRYAWLLLILLVAAALRLAALTDVPPGLTHDEADHGLAAWGVVNGDRPIYFTVGYGREPFYDYATASLMSFLGPSYLAGRLTAAFASLLLIAATYAWTRRTFGEKTALLAAAGLAVSFWAVMTGRQALRTITLPTIFMLAVLFYWRGIEHVGTGGQGSSTRAGSVTLIFGTEYAQFTIAGILLGITFYTYFPSRILWLLFPALLLFLALFDRSRFSSAWRGTLLTLGLAGIVALPLFLFLVKNPTVEVRLDELSIPLKAAVNGNLRPLLRNIADSSQLLIFKGDSHWRYNIPGRAFLSPIMVVLFVLGLGITVWRLVAGIRDRQHVKQATVAFFTLLWLVIGLSPALVTGPELSTPRIIGLQPVLYIFPALTLTAALKIRFVPRRLTAGLTILLFIVVTIQTVRDYFLIWANEPEVRVQYETALVSAMRYLNEKGSGTTALSTTTPGRYHSPAVGQLTLLNPEVDLRWFNGQHSLLIPQDGPSTIIFSAFAPLNPFLEPYFEAAFVEEIPLRPTDQDRPLIVYTADSQSLVNQWQKIFSERIETPSVSSGSINFDEAVEFLGYDLQTPAVDPGGKMILVTMWRALRPLDEAVMFTHILDSDGLPLAQSDRLDAPSSGWGAGDIILQLHEIEIPDSMRPGDYPLVVGIYTRPDLERLPVMEGDSIASDHLRLPPLIVNP